MSGFRFLSLLVLALVAAGCATVHPRSMYPIIPEPRSLEPGHGFFEMGPSTRLVVADSADAEVRRVANAWAAPVRVATGWSLPVEAGPCAARDICVGAGRRGPAQGYRLRVKERRIVVAGDDHAGLYYGLESLRQLLPPKLSGGAPVRVPDVDVRDAPRFPYRGMQLDVSRHFFGPAFVERYIDLLSLYKLNYFHWHLTDDQGWRIQIERYPKLTTVGSRRAETQVGKHFDPFVGDSTPYGGYYTQQQIRDVVAYARRHYVTIVPEIEMPGHSMAALAAYPRLACTPGPFQVGTHWGIYDDILCPKQSTFTFMDTVLTEVMGLFPGKYIHIGGDEVPGIRWDQSDTAQAVMRREGLTSTHELESWFEGRIGKFLEEHGRRWIAWDDILQGSEGGLDSGAVVMSWHGSQDAVEAAREGHDVIMTPTSPLYFDYYQGPRASEPLAIGGYNPLRRVYAYNPMLPGLTPREARHILGAQANVWTEYMATPRHVEYMALPRMMALSEVDWTEPSRKSYHSFVRRLPWHLERLDAMGVNYRIPDVVGLTHDRLTLREHMKVRLLAPAHGTIRYTLDGSEPGPGSRAYAGPLDLDVARGPVTVTARIILPDGREGPARSARFGRTTLTPAAAVSGPLDSGLRVDLFPGVFHDVAAVTGAEVWLDEPIRSVAIPGWAPEEHFGLRFRGYLSVPKDGVYTFRLTSDDGSVLRIDGRTVVDDDGPHGALAKEGQIGLARGLHRLEVLYFQVGDSEALDLEMAGPGGAMGPVPARSLHRAR